MSAARYMTGCPVSVEIAPDGTVKITVYLGEVADGLEDIEGDPAPMDDVRSVVLAITSGAAVIVASKGS